MAPKQKIGPKAALHRLENGLRLLFRSRNHTSLATEPNSQPTIALNNTNWDGLERFKSILEGNNATFGLLTSTITQFSGCVRRFENQTRAREECKILGVDLNDLFHVLAERFARADQMSITPESFGNLARSIGQEITKLLASDEGSGPKEDGSATDGSIDEILRCYRRVRTLLALFAPQMNESTTVWRLEDDEVQNTRLELLSHSQAGHYRAVGPENIHRTRCLQDTRTNVLQDLQEWVHYGKFHKVYWLSGTSGSGKTTIAYSLCEYLENSGRPAASFFCSRDLPDCRDVRRILPNVAYQLARLSRPLRRAISNSLERDPEVCSQPIKNQFERLIAMPLEEVGHTPGVDVVVVIDALEECEDKDGINQLLDAFFKDSSGLPVKFLVTSRQNLGILDRMRASLDLLKRSELRLHEIDRTVSQQDVRTYLKAGLERFGLSDDDLECLARRSGGSFIYAVSVLKYVGLGDSSGGSERLKQLLDVASSIETPSNQHIDIIYTAMLDGVIENGGLDESRKAEMMLVLRTAVCARDSLTVDAIAELLGLESSSLMIIMLYLLVPGLQVSDASGLGITLSEPFSKYLVDPQRSGRFHCNSQQDHALLVQSCFHLVGAANPSFNVCNLASSYMLDREVVDIDERVNEAISPGLWYASRHWGTHLTLAEPSNERLAALHSVLSKRLLLWMEVMNLKRSMPEAAELLHEVHLWLKQVECPVDIRDLVLDAWIFVATFSSSRASDSTPHIYVSALPFWPAHRPVSMYYMPMLRFAVDAEGCREDLAILGDQGSEVAHSPQSFGTFSRRTDNNLHPLAVGTRRPVDHLVAGHTREINSVVYSPDGAHVASGSDDKTIRVWDARTGQPVGQPFNGHTGLVFSVAYSPNGAYIASASDDCTIRIWDAYTGQAVGQPLKGHTGWVRSVAYSPDGAYLVSGSGDNTIRIWDARTGLHMGEPLSGHIGKVNSVAYSPDSAYIASGSHDNTVRIWEARTGQAVGQPLKGHTDLVCSVAYSPEGAYIASGSADRTVRIWSTRTGRPAGQPLRGHTGEVNSVAYSPDGAYIASGSDDKTVRIWDARSGQPVGQPLEGHTSLVLCVAYSPNCAYVSSSSSDMTLRIWDSRAGHALQTPGAPSPPARSLAHSPSRSLVPSVFAQYFARIPDKPASVAHGSYIHTSDDSVHRWTLDDQGWAVNARKDRLIWVPQALQRSMILPPTLVQIPRGDLVRLGFRDAKLGTEWRDCFDPSQLYS
ncbi:hypothetical protein FRC08_008298 [Ceratobasidium sp. 394]|nr:hypothetical protein FRC08_008298 [Ceratobasidium sp. 394]